MSKQYIKIPFCLLLSIPVLIWISPQLENLFDVSEKEDLSESMKIIVLYMSLACGFSYGCLIPMIFLKIVGFLEEG